MAVGHAHRRHLDRLTAAARGVSAYILEGGIEARHAAGHPVVTDRSQPIEIMRQVQIAAGTLVLIGVLLGQFVAPGFFGIGGGVLIVPGLVLATAMPLRFAIGTSLVVVSALGLTTATSYTLSGLVDWHVTGLFVAGGVAGMIAGLALGKLLRVPKGLLERGFAAVVIAVGGYVFASSL